LLSSDKQYRNYNSISLYNNFFSTINTTSSSNYFESKIVHLIQNSSFSDVQTPKNKTILFEKNIKQKSNDNDVDFDFLNKNYYSNNDSESAVKTNKKNNNNSKKSIILRKAVSRDPNDKKDVFEK